MRTDAELIADLDSIEYDLVNAYRARLAAKRRRRRVAVSGICALVLAGALAATAVAAGIGFDLSLDPTQWIVIGSGSTDDGAGAYVHAQRKSAGSHSTFMVEHDAGLPRYEAFLLHERTKDAADATSPVPVPPAASTLCTAQQLTDAEVLALQVVQENPGADKTAIVKELDAGFSGAECRGLDYAADEVLLVSAGTEPRSFLMPGAR